MDNISPASSTATESLQVSIDMDIEKFPHIKKYFSQRYRFWSKFDDGVKMDEESWYSVTPEAIAEHIARRTKQLFPEAAVVIDAFSGPGGNAIQFAKLFPRVIAIDIDPVKLMCSQHNAKIYGVFDKIEWILGDYLKLLPRLKADVVFLSPPWGGPVYSHFAYFDIKKMMMYEGAEIFHRTAAAVTPNVIYFLPRNVLPEQLSLLAPVGQVCEFENNWIFDKVKSVTCYYGKTIDYLGQFFEKPSFLERDKPLGKTMNRNTSRGKRKRQSKN